MKTITVNLYTWNELFGERSDRFVGPFIVHDFNTGAPIMGAKLYDTDPNEMVWDNTLPIKNPAQYRFSFPSDYKVE